MVQVLRTAHGYEREISHRYISSPRIAIRTPECVQLFQKNIRKPRFVRQMASGSRIQIFVFLGDTARKTPRVGMFRT